MRDRYFEQGLTVIIASSDFSGLDFKTTSRVEQSLAGISGRSIATRGVDEHDNPRRIGTMIHCSTCEESLIWWLHTHITGATCTSTACMTQGTNDGSGPVKFPE